MYFRAQNAEARHLATGYLHKFHDLSHHWCVFSGASKSSGMKYPSRWRRLNGAVLPNHNCFELSLQLEVSVRCLAKCSSRTAATVGPAARSMPFQSAS